jgi:hypothetical protein
MSSEKQWASPKRSATAQEGLIDGSQVMVTFSAEIARDFRELEEKLRFKNAAFEKAIPTDELETYDTVRDFGSGKPITLSHLVWQLPSVMIKIDEYTRRTGDEELSIVLDRIKVNLVDSKGNVFASVGPHKAGPKK